MCFVCYQGEFRVDKGGSPVLLNCLMYKLCYYRFGDLKLDYRAPSGYDRTRNTEIGNKDISLTHLEEAYTTEHWLVRIYKVKPLKTHEGTIIIYFLLSSLKGLNKIFGFS